MLSVDCVALRALNTVAASPEPDGPGSHCVGLRPDSAHDTNLINCRREKTGGAGKEPTKPPQCRLTR